MATTPDSDSVVENESTSLASLPPEVVQQIFAAYDVPSLAELFALRFVPVVGEAARRALVTRLHNLLVVHKVMADIFHGFVWAAREAGARLGPVFPRAFDARRGASARHDRHSFRDRFCWVALAGARRRLPRPVPEWALSDDKTRDIFACLPSEGALESVVAAVFNQAWYPAKHTWHPCLAFRRVDIDRGVIDLSELFGALVRSDEPRAESPSNLGSTISPGSYQSWDPT